MAPDPDRELGEARASIDRRDEARALGHLDRARRGYLKRHDLAGLEHLLVLAHVLETADEQVRIGRLNLVYAIQQNLRLETRRRAQAATERWDDPYPDLAAPTEHTRIALTGRLKLAIGAGAVLGTAAAVSVLVLPFVGASGKEPGVTLRLVNDTHERVAVRGCELPEDCGAAWLNRELDPGLTTETTVPENDVVEAFRVKHPKRAELCLPLRIHDAVARYGEAGTLVARVSEATPCPGTTVLPRATAPTGL